MGSSSFQPVLYSTLAAVWGFVSVVAGVVFVSIYLYILLLPSSCLLLLSKQLYKHLYPPYPLCAEQLAQPDLWFLQHLGVSVHVQSRSRSQPSSRMWGCWAGVSGCVCVCGVDVCESGCVCGCMSVCVCWYVGCVDVGVW